MPGRKKVGLVINPMAGRDIRRLIAFASLESQPEKALTARRILSGLAAVRGITVLLPDDDAGFFAWLKDGLGSDVTVRLVSLGPDPEDSTRLWVDRLVDAGADALIVVGGDGTQRNVAQADPPVPVLPVAGGTNNVACYLGDQTAGAYAVARFLTEGMGVDEAASQAKVLHVARDHGPEELALIDVALTRPTYTGAMAIWDPSDVQKLVLAQADPLRPGLSNVAGYQTPIAGREDGGIVLEMGAGGVRQPAVLAPGLIAAFPVRSIRHIGLNQPVRLTAGAHGGTLALDGERTVVLAKRESVQVTLRRDGPWMLEPNKIFATLRHPVPE